MVLRARVPREHGVWLKGMLYRRVRVAGGWGNPATPLQIKCDTLAAAIDLGDCDAASPEPHQVPGSAELDTLCAELKVVETEFEAVVGTSPVSMLRLSLRQFVDVYTFYLDFCRPSVLNDVDGKGCMASRCGAVPTVVVAVVGSPSPSPSPAMITCPALLPLFPVTSSRCKAGTGYVAPSPPPP